MAPTLLCVGISALMGTYAFLAYIVVNRFVPEWRRMDGSLRSVVRYIVVSIIASVLCFVVPLLITTSFMRTTGMLPSPAPPEVHALLRVFCGFGWLFVLIIFVAFYWRTKNRVHDKS